MDQLDIYSQIQGLVKLEIDNRIKGFLDKQQFSVANIQQHLHNGTDIARIDYSDLENKQLWLFPSLPGAQSQTAGNYGVFFIAQSPCYVKAVQEVHSVAGTVDSYVIVEKLLYGQGPGGGNSIMASNISTVTAQNVVQNGTLSTDLTLRRLAKGDRLALKSGGTLTTLEGVCVMINIIY